jgi:hypothetical protein
MLLGGFLVLTIMFDKTPQLRMGNSVITVITVALLTGGYSLTILVWFACPPLLFRLENVFIPAASACLFGLLSTAFCFATSPRYDIHSPAAIIAFALTSSSAILYSFLAYLTKKTVSRMIDSTGSPWPKKHFDLESGNHGVAIPVRSVTASSNGSKRSRKAAKKALKPTEQDLVNQQMATLLTRADTNARTPHATFQLEWPMGNPEEQDRRQRQIRPRTFDSHGRVRTTAERAADMAQHPLPELPSSPMRNNVWGRVSAAFGIGSDGRRVPVAFGNGRQSERSREGNRNRIEMIHQHEGWV